MPSNPIPSTFFGAGYTYAANQITLNTAAHATPLLAQVDAAEANATTGDYRRIVFGVLEMLHAKFAAATPVASKIAVLRSTYEDTLTGEFVRTYTVTVRTTPTGLEVTDE